MHMLTAIGAAVLLLAAPGADAKPAARSYDGSGNNPLHSEWGAAHQPHARRLAAAYFQPTYAETRESPQIPGARALSNSVFGRTGSSHGGVDARVSELLMAWGQFVDHDVTLTNVEGRRRTYGVNKRASCPFSAAVRSAVVGAGDGLPVPACDVTFDPRCLGNATLPFDATTGTLVNGVTAWIDGSQVYGSSVAINDALRDPNDRALMRMSFANPLSLPELAAVDPDGVVFDMANPVGVVNDTMLRGTGDVRGNENPMLTALQTLFPREHNRYARELRRNSHAARDADELFEEARRWVIGLLQHITVDEYLPALLGTHGALPAYHGFNATVDPAIDVAFASALFRFGHSQVGPVIHLNSGTHAHEVLLRDAFFRPGIVIDHYGVDAVLLGAAEHPAQLADLSVVDELRNVLFTNGSSVIIGAGEGAGGTDLMALNIARGRLHGVPTYAALRQAYGLSVPPHITDIGGSLETSRVLAEQYPRGIVDVDALVGALAEPHVPGGCVGELLSAAIRDQFARFRDGDRHWWESGEHNVHWRNAVKRTALHDVIMKNRDPAGGVSHRMSKSVMMLSSASTPVAAGYGLGVGCLVLAVVW